MEGSAAFPAADDIDEDVDPTEIAQRVRREFGTPFFSRHVISRRHVAPPRFCAQAHRLHGQVGHVARADASPFAKELLDRGFAQRAGCAGDDCSFVGERAGHR